jgi:hypothetical protein
MKREKPEWGVVVLLRRDHLILLTSDVHRTEAARMMSHAKKIHRPMKFFPVPAGTAADSIRKVNQSGILGTMLAGPESPTRSCPNWNRISVYSPMVESGARVRVRI